MLYLPTFRYTDDVEENQQELVLEFINHLEDGTALPDVSRIKHYLEWRAVGSSGLLGEKLSQVTMHNTWAKLSAALESQTNLKFDERLFDDVKNVSLWSPTIPRR